MTTDDMLELAATRDWEAEQEWQAWLLTKPPWERHYVFMRELDWHDDFMDGLIELDNLDRILARNFDQYNAKV